MSISQDRDLERRLGGLPHVALFSDPNSDLALKGSYRVEIEVLFFEPDARVEARLLSYGRVHGLAGTGLVVLVCEGDAPVISLSGLTM